MSKNYYEELIERIENLIKTNNILEALTLIKEELSLPYVPKLYEDQLKKYLDKYNQTEDKAKNFIFSKDELITMINEYKKHDKDFLLSISSSFNDYNWIGYEKELQKIFSNDEILNSVKCLIFNSLVINSLNYDFKFNENLILNPSKARSPFESSFAIINFNNLSKKDLRDPSLIEIGKKLLFIYIMNNFCDSIFYKEEDITNELVNIAKVMVGINDKHTLNKRELEIFNSINK